MHAANITEQSGLTEVTARTPRQPRALATWFARAAIVVASMIAVWSLWPERKARVARPGQPAAASAPVPLEETAPVPALAPARAPDPSPTPDPHAIDAAASAAIMPATTEIPLRGPAPKAANRRNKAGTKSETESAAPDPKQPRKRTDIIIADPFASSSP